MFFTGKTFLFVDEWKSLRIDKTGLYIIGINFSFVSKNALAYLTCIATEGVCIILNTKACTVNVFTALIKSVS